MNEKLLGSEIDRWFSTFIPFLGDRTSYYPLGLSPNLSTIQIDPPRLLPRQRDGRSSVERIRTSD